MKAEGKFEHVQDFHLIFEGYRLRLEFGGHSAAIPKGVPGANGGEHCLLPEGNLSKLVNLMG